MKILHFLILALDNVDATNCSQFNYLYISKYQLEVINYERVIFKKIISNRLIFTLHFLEMPVLYSFEKKRNFSVADVNPRL